MNSVNRPDSKPDAFRAVELDGKDVLGERVPDAFRDLVLPDGRVLRGKRLGKKAVSP